MAAVIWFHLEHITGGWLGVDAFFTLSGFLITTLLLTEHRSDGSIRLSNFWVRRARRLLPAVIIMLTAVAIVARILGPARSLHRLRLDSLAALFYVANWRAIFSNTGYWNLFSAPSPLEHMWSLAIEEQFYLVWPLVVVVALRVGKGATKALSMFVGLATFCSLTLMWVLYTPGGSTTQAYLGTGTRAASILVGASLAILLHNRGETTTPRTAKLLDWTGVVVLIPLGWAWLRVDGKATVGVYRGGLFLCAIAVAVIIAAAVVRPQGIVSRIFSFAPFRWLGTLSYGLYLWHWPLKVWMTASRIGVHGWWLDIARLAATFAVSIVSYYVIERPIRHGALRGRMARSTVIGALATVVVVTLVATAVTVAPATANGTTTDPTGTPNSIPLDPPRSAPPTSAPVVKSGTTAVTQPPQQRILVFGDSVALTVAAGLEQVQPEIGFDFLNRGFLGCGVSRGLGKARINADKIVTEHPDCHSWTTRWPRDISVYQPTIVLLVEGAWDINERQIDTTEFEKPCQPKFDAWFAGELRDAFTAITSSPTANVFVTTIPYLRLRDVPGGAERDKRINCLNAIYRTELAKTSITTVDLAQWVCPTIDSCVEKVDGIVLRPDGVHYDGPGGAVVARWLLKRILPT